MLAPTSRVTRAIVALKEECGMTIFQSHIGTKTIYPRCIPWSSYMAHKSGFEVGIRKKHFRHKEDESRRPDVAGGRGAESALFLLVSRTL